MFSAVHIPVLLEEAVEHLLINKDGTYVDCTLGGGGHSEAILRKLSKEGRLYAFDQDETAFQRVKTKLAPYEKQFHGIHANFRYLEKELRKRQVPAVDGILFDLGVSSPQLDEGERGFSYKSEARLDMRMDRRQSLTAETIVNEWPYQELVTILSRYGEEKFAKSIARRIEAIRQTTRITTTVELANIVKEAIPARARRSGGHPAKRTFQALRIAVNEELEALEEALAASISMLKPGGRLCVITFHSLEDRICQRMFKEHSRPKEVPRGLPVVLDDETPPLKIITKKPIVPRAEEIARNRRSRSAKLRVAEKR